MVVAAVVEAVEAAAGAGEGLGSSRAFPEADGLRQDGRMRPHLPTRLMSPIAAAVVSALAVAGLTVGSAPAAPAASRARTVTIEMSAVRYKPTTITVKTGEKVTFRFRNTSNLVHEALIADEKAQAAHEAMMKAMPGMKHGGHGEPYVSVAPGKTGTITTTFTKAGRLVIGCHQPGHYASGMRALLVVEKANALR